MRTLLAAALLLSPGAARADKMSEATAREIARLDARLSASETARGLIVATRSVPRVERRGTGTPETIAWSPRERAVVLDGERLPGITESDALVEIALAHARASLAAGVPVVELEQAAWQRTLRVCAELGAEDALFGRRLAEAADAAKRRDEALRRSQTPRRSPWELAAQPLLRIPEESLARAGHFMALYEKDPLEFDWAVEAGTAWPPDAVRLVEIEDFLALRRSDLAAVKSVPEGPYALVAGRRYPAALVRAALSLRGGGLERIKETLGPYDTAERDALRAAINRWRRAAR